MPIAAEADFCITGTVDPAKQLPEGPFGDHLGYYSLAHDFPVLRVEHVYHRTGAIWPFTVVGRPPQEDTSFGQLIHELTGPVIPTVIAGVKAVHAVDAAGVHPLLLAIGSERYVPYAQSPAAAGIAHAGQRHPRARPDVAGQVPVDRRRARTTPELDIHDMPAFFRHVLQRVDWTTGPALPDADHDRHARLLRARGLNEGSKVVIAAAGEPRRELPTEIPSDLRLPDGFHDPRLCLPGVLAIAAPPYRPDDSLRRFCTSFEDRDAINRFPLIVLVDDSEFTARRL